MTNLNYLVGIDGSEWSERAIERAVTLAQSSKASVKMLYVLDWSILQPMIVEGIVPPMIDKDQEYDNIMKNVLAPLMAKYADSGVEITTEAIWGDPVETIHSVAKSEHANMIFVGRRGRSRFADLLLGSVANKIAHCAGVPVVLVP